MLMVLITQEKATEIKDQQKANWKPNPRLVDNPDSEHYGKYVIGLPELDRWQEHFTLDDFEVADIQPTDFVEPTEEI